MSTTPGGPGWWQAPDGRWYPPQPPGPPQQPGPPPRFSAGPGVPPRQGGPPPWTQPGPPVWGGWPPSGGPPPGYPTPGYGGPPPAPPSGSKTKVILITVGSAVAVVVLAGLALSWAVSGIAGSIGVPAGNECAAVSTADVDAELGGRYDVIQLGGALGGLTTPVLDSRVLPDAELTCWAVEAGSADTGRLARIARHEGVDAQQRFAAERTAAMGTTENRGGGLSVSTAGYFNKVVTAGDEAFCTSGDLLGSAGALVRRGNLLVYVSTTAAGDGTNAAPDFQIPTDPSATTGIALGTDDANCALAVTLAAKVS